MEVYKGIPVSPGVVIGRVVVLGDSRVRVPRRQVKATQVEAEVARFEEAVAASVAELESLRQKAETDLGGEAAKIFAFHQGMLHDRALTEPIRERIRNERVTADYASSAEFRRLAEWFARMSDSSFFTKVDDVWDLERRVLRQLLGEQRTRLSKLEREAVVIAHDLTPSEAASFERGTVMAFATDAGGRTSHTAIVAHALGIPAVVGVGSITDHARDGDTVIIDGDRGVVILHPDEETIREHEAYIERMRLFGLSLADLRDETCETRDGVHVALYGNIEFASEAATVLAQGGLGVGLYRTEFLWLISDHEPSEEEQYTQYAAAVEALRGKVCTFRTLDLGADKYTQSRAEEPERNPFLGLRSIRYSLQNLPMFRRQLRALLRASALGPSRIMFPLITTAMELRQAKMVLHDVMEDLEDEGLAFDRDVPVGMMVESPSAAVMAASFAKECDFFSIGTNDLVQYVLAVDRTNENVASLYTAAHPAVLKLMKEVVRAARRAQIEVSCCGEIAGDIEYTMLLIGIGLRSLSVSPGAIPLVKRVVRSVDIAQCERLARKVGSFDSERQVAAFLRDQARKIIPEAFDGRSVETD
ncbi:MAG: phosphoenolpyruvate--protein phosphotransferase [Phycisphaerales bacterium]|nr:MAG: phosphoenolpyruvate--protein phosphotransferase [Phycisphaerales bacterium]